jgi:hypothetical protein
MNTIESLVTEQNITLLGALFGTAWTLFKGSEWFQRARARRLEQAVTALEAGIEQTYQVYVRAIKESNADGRLSTEERRRAREMARAAAVAFGRTQGIDVLREIGADYVDLWISRLVNQRKTAKR